MVVNARTGKQAGERACGGEGRPERGQILFPPFRHELGQVPPSPFFITLQPSLK